MKFYIVFFIGFLGWASCHTNKGIEETAVVTNEGFVLLDSIAAAQAIVIDKTDAFFEHVTIVDMAIQMKRQFKNNETRAEILIDYKNHIQADVEDFTPSEKVLLHKIMQKSIRLCDSLSNKLLPPSIELIKTKGGHYGNGAFYTRENRIIIPASDLKNPNEKQLTQVMLHEISHIVSRYNPVLRDKLYGLIGFEKMLSNSNLIINNPLKKLLLANPDGMNMEYAIQVHKPDGKLIWALPLLFSGEHNFKSTKPAFFNYLKFELFELEKQADGRYLVLTKENGSSTLMLQNLPDFFKKIGDNTQYIIHPDEIIADNFFMMALATQEIDGFDMGKFSAKGKVLIQDVEKAVREY